MPGEDKNFGGSLVLDFRKWWRHVKTIYNLVIQYVCKYELSWYPAYAHNVLDLPPTRVYDWQEYDQVKNLSWKRRKRYIKVFLC